MPTTLLPASAAAFAPRASPTVVLNSRPEPWLTATLKRVNRVKRPLNNVTQHTRCLTDLLSSQKALWNLCSIMVPKTPESEERKEEDSTSHPMANYQLLHIEAYVVHVDMVSQHEVAFKLTPETIESLVDYHKEVYSVDAAANTWDWSEKSIQVKKLQEDFVQAANKFVFRTNALALEGMEDEGSGELLCGRSADAKAAVLGLFAPLLPPPPRIVDVVRAAPLLPSSCTGGEDDWFHSPVQHPTLTTTTTTTLPMPSPAAPVPVDPWHSVGSSCSPPPSTCTSISSSDATIPDNNMWVDLSAATTGMELPSPLLSQSLPFSTEPFCAPPQFYSAAPAPVAAIPQFTLPSMLAQQQCGAAAMGVGWGDRYLDLALPYGMTM